jgi:hypothetical protein
MPGEFRNVTNSGIQDMNRLQNSKENSANTVAGVCGAAVAAGMLALFATGCSMCCGPHDFEYPVFQSRYARVDPEYGRVGSVFSDPNVMPGTKPLTNADVPRKEERPGMDDDENKDSGTDDPEFRQTPEDQNKTDQNKTDQDPNPFQGEPDPNDTQDTQDTAVKYRNPVPPRRR